MDLSTIVDYLVEQGELVDEQLLAQLKEIFLKSPDNHKDLLQDFFEKHFPQLSTPSFLTCDQTNPHVSIIKSFEKLPVKRTVQHFAQYFALRFRFIENILKNRTELSSLVSISRLKTKKDKEKVSIIGMIQQIDQTKNGHFIIILEDLSGTTKVLINKNNPDLLQEAKKLVLDEVIGVVGTSGKDIVFSDLLLHPDVPLSKELKRSPYDNYAIFFGDAHFGSKEFLRKEFHKMLLWLNGKLGTMSQRIIAKKVKYIFMVGDVIEGVGIYPSQEEDLEVHDVRSQYELAAKYLKKIPSHIKIIICPGNHDVGRIAEPQLPLDKEYAKDLWELPNVIMVSNPAYVAVDVTRDFSGISVLMYHGYSLIHFADNVPYIREKGGQKLADEIMEFLLKRRHLAPTHGSTLYIPDIAEDALLIDRIPDIFVTGHIHRAQSRSYRNVTCINSSGWTAITEDQEKRGLEPQPGRAFAVSLKTREVKVLNFSTTKDAASVAELRRQQQQREAKVEQ